MHILRAPNSNSNRLEVNTNCLDDKRDVKEIRVKGDLSGMSLGSGKALDSKRSPRPARIHEDHEEGEGDSLWMKDEDFLQTMSRDNHPHGSNATPATFPSSTVLPGGSVFSAASSIADDYDDISTLRGSEASSTINSHYNLRSSSLSVNGVDNNQYNHASSSKSVGAADAYYNRKHSSIGGINNSDAGSIRTWAVGSDNSIAPHSSSSSILPPSTTEGISLPSMPFDERPPASKRAPPSSAIMKDQLQFYMKKHLQSAKSADGGDLEKKSISAAEVMST